MSSGDDGESNTGIGFIDNPINATRRAFNGGGGESAMDQIGDKRTAQYNSNLAAALDDPTIDTFTKNQLRAGIFETGTLEGDIEAAKKGSGVFGRRRRNEQLALLMQDRPGVSQLVLAAGNRPVGDTTASGLPSLIGGNIDTVGIASIIAEAKEGKKK